MLNMLDHMQPCLITTRETSLKGRQSKLLRRLSLTAAVPNLHLSYSFSTMQQQEIYANNALLAHLT